MTSLNFPDGPADNQTFTGTNNIVYIYDGGKWTSLGSITNSDSDKPTVSMGSIPPNNPEVGELWFNTVKGILFVWYRDESQSGVEGQWTDARPPVN